MYNLSMFKNIFLLVLFLLFFLGCDKKSSSNSDSTNSDIDSANVVDSFNTQVISSSNPIQ